MNAKRYVVVTTSHDGVFYGELVEQNDATKIVQLKDAKNCLSWTADVRGFMGLACSGPSETCRVGPAVPTARLCDVTAILDVTGAARKAWDNSSW